MTAAIRQHIAKKLAEAAHLSQQSKSSNWLNNLHKLPWCVRIVPVTKRTEVHHLRVSVPFQHLESCSLLQHTRLPEQMHWGEILATKSSCDDCSTKVEVTDRGFDVCMNFDFVTKPVLEEIATQQSKYGLQSKLHDYVQRRDGHVEPTRAHNIVVEYSSPNIAKPFHAGHLRSTILGNYIANLAEALGHHVIRINYLGDWGTQFGLLGVAFKKYGLMDKLKEDAMQHLFDIYVKINTDVRQEEEAGKSSTIHKEGMEFFHRMEQGDKDALNLWKMCRDYSIEEFSKMYERLGVRFDEYHGEAMYHGQSINVVEEFRSRGLLQINSQTGVGYIQLGDPDSKKYIHGNLLKSDGTTLYLTRDYAAALDRKQRYNFDKMYYVVENGQHMHFKQLVYGLRMLGCDWACIPPTEFHVKFGRIEGMSTRRGQVVFLRNILDEAQSRMIESMKAKKTTKLDDCEDMERVADTLGVSAIIIQDLKQRRLTNYKFDWEKMLKFTGDTGIFLQYTHARLCSLERNAGVTLDPHCATDTLTEPEARRLVQLMARFDETLQYSHAALEPSHLVQYLFTLCHLVSTANETLYVKGELDEVAKARLLLFHCSRIVLANGLHLLGITPLEKM
ncbi:putative arginine--tRNA ligase, mitochondrial [Lamellibrachia satsuma]|nr:putative arginine--tRNA ligase, mitochondrial [Lamellibrachia satsuma]